jgi:hypothetical protein
MLVRKLAQLVPVVSGAICAVAVAAAIVTTSPEASARSDYDSTYGYDRTWNAAIRMVHVDMGFKVTEKDEASGFLLFEYKSPESPRPSPGSMEFVRSKDDGEVRVIVQLAQMPRYHEQLMVDTLVKKMRADYGDPPTVHPAPPPTSDAGLAGD